MCDPSTITLIANVAATMLAITLIGTGASIVDDAASEFACQLVVISRRRPVQVPVVVHPCRRCDGITVER
jgi:hypothetical protein